MVPDPDSTSVSSGGARRRRTGSGFQPQRWRAGSTLGAVALLHRVAPGGRPSFWAPVIAIIMLVVVAFWTDNAVASGARAHHQRAGRTFDVRLRDDAPRV
jgi:hypothetical protein